MVDADCQQGKHRACPGWTFNPTTDRPTDCTCPCHEGTA